MNFILESGHIKYNDSVKILIGNAIFTGGLGIYFEGMEETFDQDSDPVSYTFDQIQSLGVNNVSIDSQSSAQGIIWHLNQIKPSYRQQIADNQSSPKWVYRNNSNLIYNCIWNID